MGGKIGRYLIIHDQQKTPHKTHKTKRELCTAPPSFDISLPLAGLGFAESLVACFHFFFVSFCGLWWMSIPREGYNSKLEPRWLFWRRSSCNYLIYLFGIFGHLGVCWFFSLLHMNLKFYGQCPEDAEILIIVWPETCLEFAVKKWTILDLW